MYPYPHLSNQSSSEPLLHSDDKESQFSRFKTKYPRVFPNIFASLLTVVAVTLSGVLAYVAPADSEQFTIFASEVYGTQAPPEVSEVQPPVTGDETTVTGDYELGWREETNTLKVSSSVNKGAPGQFSSDYPDAQDYLNQLWPTETIQLIYTDDPKYNCGVALANDIPQEHIAGGCYRGEYGKVLFLWWGSSIPETDRKLLLLHEFSHYVQQYKYFDALISAYNERLYEDTNFVANVLEADASCRVVYEWKLAQPNDYDNWSAPCNINGWYEGWLKDQIAARIIIEDY